MYKLLIAFFLIVSQTTLAQNPVELKLATIAPEGSAWLNRFRHASELIFHQTDGRVNIRWYAGGVMGSESQVLQKIRFGQLQGGMFTASGILDRYPGLNTYTIPFLFQNDNEIALVREEFDHQLISGLYDTGFTSYGLISGGNAYVMSTAPIESLDDLSRMRVWTPEGDPVGYATLESLGLPAVILPLGDVLLGLQTGLIDVAAATPSAGLILQWHTAIQYIIDLPVAYTIGSLLIDNRSISKISPEDQSILSNHLSNASLDLDRLAASDNEEALAVLQSLGINMISIDNQQVDLWYQKVETSINLLGDRKDVDQLGFKNILEFLNNHR